MGIGGKKLERNKFYLTGRPVEKSLKMQWRFMDVQLRDVIMSIWTRISGECFQNLVGSEGEAAPSWYQQGVSVSV